MSFESKFQATREVEKRTLFDLSKFVELRAESQAHRLREWERKNAVRIAKQTYGELFRQVAFGQQMSERYADSLQISLINKNTLSGELKLGFRVNYFDETGKIPLWKFFEEGTRSHWIYPRNAKALRWKTGSLPPTAGATGASVYAFSKANYVSGIKPRKVLYWTLKRGTQKFANQMAKEGKKFLQATASKVGI
jgi:hypothetical protein